MKTFILNYYFLLFATSLFAKTANSVLFLNTKDPLKSSITIKKSLINPTITSFSPTSGLIGTTVTILGTNFSDIPESNIVQFNGITASVTSASETILTVIVPSGATSGAIDISVNNLTVTSSSIFTILQTSTCNGISKNYANHWYFGNQAALRFDANGPVALTNSAMSQTEGVATISDANGNLLFYTNGITIYNKNHQIMANGTGLTSHSSNTQAAFIVPFPSNPDKYFVVTPDPYYYSIVDMTLDNGNGAIEANSKNVLITNERSEKVAGLFTSNQRDIWLITYGQSQKRFNVYKITSSGISATPVISEFTTASGYYGYMKISPDGTKIAMANFNQSFHLYDFNANTGIVSNQRIINFSPNIGGFGSYGIEFSPNSNLVYLADHRGQNKVFQFDLTQASSDLIAGSMIALEANIQALGGLQLGPDGKIYVAREGAGFLGVINQPNVVGSDCNYISDGVSLGGKTSNLGLPGFVASSLVQNQPYISEFTPSNGVVGTTVTISGIDFSNIAANNIVKFNGLEATVITATTTTITVDVPAAATTGKISIEVGCSLVASTNDFNISNLGINQISNTNNVLIYPNPTSGILNISLEKNISIDKIIIIDMLGKTVLTKSTNPAFLDISSLKIGLYFAQIYSADNMFLKKIIKK